MPMDEHAGLARGIVDANVYLTIGSASAGGSPWATPVFFAASADYRSYYWVSSPLALHSRNIAQRPSVSLLIFNSQVRPGDGQAVYMTATASKVASAEMDAALRIYPGEPSRGGRRFEPADISGAAPYRLYRATASRFWILDPDKSPDQRVEVSLSP
jgi:hypothetical protein